AMIYNNSINKMNQPERRPDYLTIGRLAPDFTALSTQGYVRLSDYRGKWLILTSHPSAFGAVSTTEIISAAQNYSNLKERNIEVVGLTTDNIYANLAWVNDIYQRTGISVPFPIISDNDFAISEAYDMVSPDKAFEQTVRGIYIIDPTGHIRAIVKLPVSTGGSSEELLRIIDSILLNEQYNLYTPAGWIPGEPVIVPNPISYEEMVSRAENSERLGYYCPFWYLCYENLNTAPGQGNNNISGLPPAVPVSLLK
ncbi:MAG: redoxin domain-containing protein, partial [Sedimentibacter sp.]|nr:redoxin domain-containing protein [Sedimentibacter sp.]